LREQKKKRKKKVVVNQHTPLKYPHAFHRSKGFTCVGKLNKEKERGGGEWFSGGFSAKAGLNKRERRKTDLEGKKYSQHKNYSRKRKVKRERGNTDESGDVVTAE
jgi:hypothetical protein